MKNATSILMLSFVGFAVVLAGFIGSRLNEQAVALLAGTICGIGIALPLGMVIGWYVGKRRAAEHATLSAQPTVIMTQPQVQPARGYAGASPNGAWNSLYASQPVPLLAPRQFTIVGEETFNHDSESVW